MLINEYYRIRIMKISVKFRKRNGVPFAVEKISGVQFRCGYCGKIFYDRKELDIHLKKESNNKSGKPTFPAINKNITVSAIYTRDVRDSANAKYPKLSAGDDFLQLEDINFNEK